MRNHLLHAWSKRTILILALLSISASTMLAQDSPFTAAMKTNLIAPVTPSGYVSSSYVQSSARGDAQHYFWDRNNAILFTVVGASATADFFVTRANLNSGGRELNPVTRVFAGSTTGLAMNFVGETAGTIGLSYFFHKTGHHKLERLTSFVDASMSMGAVGYGLSHR
jgi:hypothetical protein